MAIDYVSTTSLQPRGYSRTTRGAHKISIKIIDYRFNHVTIRGHKNSISYLDTIKKSPLQVKNFTFSVTSLA